jgi:hypothetical protein
VASASKLTPDRRPIFARRNKSRAPHCRNRWSTLISPLHLR